MPSDLTANRVAQWMNQATRKITPKQLPQLFNETFKRLIGRAEPKLGVVVLTAILERVFYNGSQRYPMVSALKSDALHIDFRETFKPESASNEAEIRDAFEFVLVEFFSIIDRLTGDLLTPALYSELNNILIDSSSNGQKENV